jgi:hypothetical protein
MKLTPQSVATFTTGLTVVAALTTLGGGAMDPAWADDTSPTSEVEGVADSPDGGDDASTDAPSFPDTAPASEVSMTLSGALTCAVPAMAEASMMWRYGRARSDASINETTSHVRISSSGSGCDGLKVDVSFELVAAELRPGSYVLGATSNAHVRAPSLWASLWARRDRSSATPDLEWDTRAWGGKNARLTLIITSMTEISHAAERLREGTVTRDTTRFLIHGSIRGSLPCTEATSARRPSCRIETLVGSF